MTRDYLTMGKINRLDNNIETMKKRYNAFKQIMKKENRKPKDRDKEKIQTIKDKMKEVKSEYLIMETERFNLTRKIEDQNK
jgi:hypothetical protein